MLFVDNDKPQSGKMEGNSDDRATYHHPRTRVMQHFFPYIHPLVIREFGMVNHHFFSEHILQSAGKLCCKGNFRNQEQRLVASDNTKFMRWMYISVFRLKSHHEEG